MNNYKTDATWDSSELKSIVNRKIYKQVSPRWSKWSLKNISWALIIWTKKKLGIIKKLDKIKKS